MLARLKKWGNSQGIRVPKALLEQSQISIEEPVEIDLGDPTGKEEW